jgi:hypothetical protein
VHGDAACSACGTQPIVGVRHRSVFQRGVSVCDGCARSGAESVSRAGPYITMGVSRSSSSAGAASSPPASRPLVEFCWHYFRQGGGAADGGAASAPARAAASGDAFAALRAGSSGGGGASVRETTLPPLYLQYDGHSVTVVGVERRPRSSMAAAGAAIAASSPTTTTASWGPLWRAHDYALLVLDPSVPSQRLEAALASGAASAWAPLVRRPAAGALLSRPGAQYQVLRTDRATRRAAPMRGGELDAAKTPVAYEWYTT